MWRIRLVLLVFFIVHISCLFSQTAIINGEEKENQFITLAPRVGIGVHNYFNLEAGFSLIYVYNEPLAWGAASVYSTFIVQQDDWDSGFNVKGVKFGVQSTWAIFMWGIEYKSLFSVNSNYNYLSPKIGLGWMDVMNIEYAINVIEVDKNKSYSISSRHQVSINISINKKLHKEIYKEFF